MRKKIFSLFVWALMIFMMCSSAWADVPIDEAHFPDPVFRTVLSNTIYYDKNGDKILSDKEIEAITSLYPSLALYGASYKDYEKLASVEGIEYLTNLRELYISGTQVSKLDLGKNTELRILECANCKNITALDVSNNKFLNKLHCDGTKIAALDLSKNKMLLSLSCGGYSDYNFIPDHTTPDLDYKCYIEELDLSENKQLTHLYIECANIVELNLSNNINLVKVQCSSVAKLKHIDVRNCLKLETLNLQNTIELEELDVSNNILLTELRLSHLPSETNDCKYGKIKTLDLQNNINLKVFHISGYQLHELDLSNNINLEDVYLGYQMLYANYTIEDTYFSGEEHDNYKAILLKVNLSEYIKSITNVKNASVLPEVFPNVKVWYEKFDYYWERLYSYNPSTGIMLIAVLIPKDKDTPDFSQCRGGFITLSPYDASNFRYIYDTHSPISDDYYGHKKYMPVYIKPFRKLQCYFL